MKKKQTAVKLLEEQYYESEGKLTRHDFDQAKQMEKEQIINSWVGGKGFLNGEQYYNETYGEKFGEKFGGQDDN